jgi:hypothetical protein
MMSTILFWMRREYLRPGIILGGPDENAFRQIAAQPTEEKLL